MMHYLLSRSSRAIIQRLAHEQTLCAFDFDGTLAPIVAHPDSARMRERTLRLFERLASIYPCVVISGRSRADVLHRLEGVKVAAVVGNHGAEPERTTGRSHRRVRQWRNALERSLPSVDGLLIEDKGLSLAVHYRLCSHKIEVRHQILNAAARLPNVRIFGGKQVINIVFNKAPHKGDVLAAERDRLGCNWVLYVGDDITDEDAFALRGNIVPIRIGRRQRSHARYYLRTQVEIDNLLELLGRMRADRSVR
jgi:trehalose 6-phosphate phosphatase